MTLKNPDRVIVDIQGAWLSAKVKREISVSSRFVNDIRIGQFNKNTVRLVVENKVGSSNYKIFPLKGGTVPGRVVLEGCDRCAGCAEEADAQHAGNDISCDAAFGEVV